MRDSLVTWLSCLDLSPRVRRQVSVVRRRQNWEGGNVWPSGLLVIGAWAFSAGVAVRPEQGVAG